MRNHALFAAGLALGAANKWRHQIRGYKTPRPFDPASVAATIRHVSEVVSRLESRATIGWSGKRVLEIGPGSDLATGALILNAGASRYVAVDAFDNRDQASPRLYEALADDLGAPVDLSRLEFTLAHFPSLPEVDGPFDLIVSNATLEHIEAIPLLFARLRELAAPGARMAHHIDGQTHMRWFNQNDPLNILRYGDGIYRRVLSFPGAPNRLRAGDYVGAANAAGWSDVRVVAGRQADPSYLAATQPALASRFRDREDLGSLTFTLVADC